MQRKLLTLFLMLGGFFALQRSQAQTCTGVVLNISAANHSTSGTTSSWQVPSGGPYKVRITAKGGDSQNSYVGGKGRTMIGDFIVASEQVLDVNVGSPGGITTRDAFLLGGGGGGSGVKIGRNYLLVAGGGASPAQNGGDANQTTSGSGVNTSGGTNGGVGGVSDSNGGSGGGNGRSQGSGGGYSGGTAGASFTNGAVNTGGAGGADSYNIGTNQNNATFNNGGQVIIECLGSATLSATATPTQPICTSPTQGSVSIDLTGDLNGNTSGGVEYAIVSGNSFTGTPTFADITADPFNLSRGFGTMAGTYTLRVRLKYNPTIFVDQTYNIIPVVDTDNDGKEDACDNSLTVNADQSYANENGIADVGEVCTTTYDYTLSTEGSYAPIPGSGTPVTFSDDVVSEVLPIGFNFSFYGNDYTQFRISSNGFITFAASLASGCCSGQLLPNPSFPNNLIAGAWDDLYPPGGGSINYFVTGTAPNRVLVVNFSAPVCCGQTLNVSFQIQLYETSNVIKIHTDFANGIFPATMGIENSNGMRALAVPGRNRSSWQTLNDDYVAFIPTCCEFVVPSSTISTVGCPALATVPTPPTVTTSCGETLIPTGPVISEDPNPLTCEGTRTYTWTYTYNNSAQTWSHTYTIEREPFTVPANGSAMVACPALAVAPTTLPTVTSNCGETLTPTGPVVTNDPNPLTCEGTRTYAYTYTDCEGNTAVWSFTYTIEREPFTVPVNGSATVSSLALAVAPTTLPTVTSNCGVTLTPTGPVVTNNPNPLTCEGTRTYAYTYTDCEGNTAVWSFTYTVEREPFTTSALNATASSNSPMCIGGVLELSATGGSTYSWVGPNGYNSVQQNPTRSNATISMSGVYSVTVSNGFCTATASTSVVVQQSQGSANLSSNSPVCAGSALNLSATGGSAYTWAGPGGYSSTSQNPRLASASLSMSGTYSITVRNVGGCTATGVVAVVVSPNVAPSITSLRVNGNLPNSQTNTATACTNAPVNLNITATNAVTYSWRGPTGAGSGFTSSLVSPVTMPIASPRQGQYTVTVRNGCQVFNQRVINLQLTNCSNTRLASAEDTDAIEMEINAYPNPVSKTLRVEVRLKEPAALQLRLLNSIGQESGTWQLGEVRDFHQTELNLADLPGGVYLLEAAADRQRAVKRVVKIQYE